MSKMMKSAPGVRIILAALLLAVFVLSAGSCSKEDEKKSKSESVEAAIPVQVVDAGAGAEAGALVLTGVLEPANQTNLTGKIGGTIQSIKVEVGDRVKKGAVLATLDQSNFILGVNQAQAAYETAKLAAEVAEIEWKRIVSLKQDQSIAQADYERAEVGYRSATNGLRQAEVGLDLAKNNLADSVIRAPYDGQLIARMVSPGAHVDPMMGAVLFVMADTSRLRAALKLPETRAQFVKIGDPVKIHVASAGRTFEAKIDAVTDSVDPMTHTRTAVAWVENAENPIAGGVFFEARILPESLAGKMLLPAASVREEEGKFFTYVVKDGRASRRQIEGSWLADRGSFLLGTQLEAGSKVITEVSMVRDGQPVAVTASK